MHIANENIYDVIIITNRNYGFYTAYATNILGLKTKVIYSLIAIKNKESTNNEPKIWNNEKTEDYLYILDKFQITYEYVKEKHILYFLKNNLWHISYNDQTIVTHHLILAISNESLLIGNKNVTLEDFQVQNQLYLIGERALYENKIFMSEIYTGEANLVAQQIYKKVNQVENNITIHSTEFNFTG
jgi:hypothetical protein